MIQALVVRNPAAFSLAIGIGLTVVVVALVVIAWVGLSRVMAEALDRSDDEEL
jgi:hypothetical protein